MAESNGSNRVWMVIALVAIVAAIFFAVSSPNTAPDAPVAAQPEAKVEKAAEAAAPPVEPASLPVEASPQWPEAPEVGDEPMEKAIEGNYIRDLKHVKKLAREAVQKAGGAQRLGDFIKATYKRSTGEAGMMLTGELLHDGGRMTIRTDRETGFEYGVHKGDRCWSYRDDVVTGCTQEDTAKLVLAQAIHDSTVLLPLRRKPYKLKSVAVLEHDDKTVNRYQYDLHKSDWQISVLQDPATLRPLRVSISRADRRMEPLHCDLGNYRNFGGVHFATLRGYHFQDIAEERGSHPRDPAYTVTISEVRPGVAGGRLKARKPTKKSRVKVFKRRPLLVVEGAAGEPKDLFNAWVKTEELIPAAHNTLQPEWYAVMGSGQDTAGLAVDMKVWVSPISSGGAVQVAGFRNIAGAEFVAHQVVRADVADLAERYAEFLKDVRSKGHAPVEGTPRIAWVLNVPYVTKDHPANGDIAPPDDKPWTFDLQVVVSGK
jgi:hypothetical protein